MSEQSPDGEVLELRLRPRGGWWTGAHTTLAVLLVLVALVALWAASQGVWPVAALGLVGVGLLAAPVVLTAQMHRPGVVHVHDSGHGLQLMGSSSPRRIWTAAAALLFLLPVSLLAPALGPSGEVSPALTRVAIVVGAVLAPVAIVGARRHGNASMWVTRDGVAAVTPRGVPLTLEWGAVPPYAGGRPDLARGLAVPPLVRAFPIADIAADPWVVAELLELYRANPRLRAEIHDGRALQRLREDRLTA